MTTTSPLANGQGKAANGALRGGKAEAYMASPITGDSNGPLDVNPAPSMLPGPMPTGGTHGRSTFPNLKP